jgi:carotenoid cleavage dioxygenase-like enzyme
MSQWSRRSFLSSAIKGIPAATLVQAGCATPKTSEELSDLPQLTDSDEPQTDEPAEDSGNPDINDTGDSADTDEPLPTTLADTGPVLENRWPTSLTRAVQSDLDVELKVLSGTLPDDMTGHAFTTYPHPKNDGNPQFIGDGMAIRLDFDTDKINLVRRVIRSPCFYADQATLGTDDAFEASGMARFSMSLGIRNSLNTNPLVMDDRLFFAYDGGRPWEIDTETLQPITAVGYFDEWMSIVPTWISWLKPWPFPVVLTSAHPVREPRTGEMYTINFGMNAVVFQPFTRLIRWDGEGPFESWNLKDEEGRNVEIVQSAHQVAVTEDFIVFVDIAMRMEMEDMLGFETAKAQIPDATVWIVPRSELVSGREDVTCKRVIIPREATHYLVDYLNPDGQITMYISHNCATDPSEFLKAGDTNAVTDDPVRPDMIGFMSSGTDTCGIGRYVIDVASKSVIESEVLFDDDLMVSTAALYTHKEMDVRDVYENVYWLSLGFSEDLRLTHLEDLYADYPYRRTDLSDLPTETKPGSIFRIYQPTMEIEDSYIFPNGRVAVSPQFIPREGSSSDTDGYLIVWVASDDTETENSTGDELWVFDAADLNQGPLVRLGHPDLDLPFTLHTSWMQSIGPRTATYQVHLREDIGDAVSRQSSTIRSMFENEVFPHFE